VLYVVLLLCNIYGINNVLGLVMSECGSCCNLETCGRNVYAVNKLISSSSTVIKRYEKHVRNGFYNKATH